MVNGAFGVIGHDYYGVFPLKGKVKNVRGDKEELDFSEEIIAIKKIMGLEQGKIYTDVGDLNYGHIMILTDQDK